MSFKLKQIRPVSMRYVLISLSDRYVPHSYAYMQNYFNVVSVFYSFH